MNGILISAVLVLLCEFVGGFAMVPQLNVQEKALPGDASYKNTYTVLQSIENRIQNLESTINIQYTTIVEGKMEYYGRKIENIEKDVARFEAYVRIEMDKLLENISNRNFKEDITNDRTIRKIDSVYERINHKLHSIEGQIDVTNIKSQNARDTILSKLDKIEESISIRNSDLEAEITDVGAAIDDLKIMCTAMEENLVNVTRDSLKTIVKSGEKASKKQVNQAINVFEDVSKNISTDVLQLQTTINMTMNQSLDTYSKMNKAKLDLEESMNEYANKITDMYSDLWKKADAIDNTIKNLAVVTNVTRNEQQNGLRALMVQVGRKSPKSVQSETIPDNTKLTEIIKKIDSNFENVLTAQNLFLESCHRVQMDESQLESQISIVLDKLIDTFENKTAVGPKDIKRLEHLIRNHDSNIRKSVYHITSHLLNLIQKNSDNKDEIVDYVKSQLLHLDALHIMVHDAINIKSSEHDNGILHELQVLQQTINKTQTSLEHTNSMNVYITKMLNSTEWKKLVNTTKLDEVIVYLKNISAIVTSIEQKFNKSYVSMFFNKHNIEIVGQEFVNQLKEYIQWIVDNNNTNTIPERTITNILEENRKFTHILLDILNSKPYNNSHTLAQLEETEEIANIILLCDQHINSSCAKTHMTQYDLFPQNTENLPTSNINEGAMRSYLNHTTNSTNTQNPEAWNLKISVQANMSLNTANSDLTANPINLENATRPLNSNQNISLIAKNFSTLIDRQGSNLLPENNSNESIHPIVLKHEANVTVVNEETSTPIPDIEKLFQTTQNAEYLQTEEQFSATTVREEFVQSGNRLSTIFEDVQRPD